MIMRPLRAPMTPNPAAELEPLIRSSLAARVRIWEELPQKRTPVAHRDTKSLSHI
jgi:hypothetical protein